MTEETFNMDQFTHAIYLNAPLEKVYEYAATPSGIIKWFMGKAKYFYKDKHIRLGNDLVQKGDTFLWNWLEKDLELKGIVTEAVENKTFQFTFSPLYLVTLKFYTEKGRTKLTLTQEYQESADKNDFNYINCCTCWVFFLTNLKSVIENGTDLRETEVKDEMAVNR